MELDKKIAAICGKILKYDFSEDKKTNIIDSAGLYCFRNRRVIDEGQGMEDKGQYNKEKEVFGVSGACPIYRREALEDVKIFGEYFDEDFFMYKEDVDLSWRFRLFGWKCYYLPEAIGYHGRGTGILKRFSHLEVLKNRGKLSKFTKYYSYKNQRLMQLKNEFALGFLRNFFPIIWKEILVKGYIIFREPYLIKAMFHLLSQMPRALKKRKYIMKNRRVGWREMEHWLSGKEIKS
jgi:GT2 family glycosyltransferase